MRISANPTGASDFKSLAIFDTIQDQLTKDGASYVKKIKGVFCFKVKKGSEIGVWVVDAKNGNGSVKFDPKGKGDVTINVGDEDLLALMSGKLNPQQAFFQGKIKIAGNMGLAMKLKDLQPPATKAKL
eukprot:GHVO01008079.1.p1 GENE.GHVO01008079.1~~GHVO01008079.1.p1  ORF type:complete len:128 (+),score=26.13 GHVO01008079.1:96-479(+)